MSSPEKLKMSVEEFDVFSLLPENANRHLEFIAGEIVEKMVSHSRASKIAKLIGYYIQDYLFKKDIAGELTGADGGYKVGDERYIPDVGFTAPERLTADDTWLEKAPDLAIEVISPTDRRRDIQIKTTNYMNAGTEVWLIDPIVQTIEVYIAGKPVSIYGVNDTLKDSQALPGFELVLKKVFRKTQE